MSESPPLTPLTPAARRRLVGAWLRDRGQFARKIIPRTCPICGFHGIFISVGKPARWDARCLNCGCRERHRLTWLWIHESGQDRFAGKKILHFAPEKVWMRKMRGNPLYETADWLQPGVTHKVDITDVALPNASYDVVMAHHVLEHIDDDHRAMAELFRLLRPGGLGVFTVPVNVSRHATYENPAITSPELRTAHFSAPDHRRYYGLDFSKRLEGAGFTVETWRMEPAQEPGFGLLRDEWVYIARKPG